MSVWSVLIFILGAAFGSFLNVVIFRMKKKQSFLTGRSYCPNCRHKLGARDLIPLVSFVIQKGKCRYCKSKISLVYPLVELGTGLAFLLIFINFGFSLKSLLYLVYACILIIIFVYDLNYNLILDKVTVPAMIFAILADIILKAPFFSVLFGAIIGGSFFSLMFFLSRGKWIGGGDIRLGVLMGLMLGWEKLIVALVFAYLPGALVAIILLITKKKKLRSSLPFGTFLTLGTFIALIYGSQIIAWYLSGALVNWYLYPEYY
jgi:prepilin signal peptidase PulO-like enzyme (type II secretory pathway)